MTFDVIFEKQSEEGWQPTRFQELKQGDVARMKTPQGEVIKDEEGQEQFEVSGCNGTDPDTHRHFDLCLNPMG